MQSCDIDEMQNYVRNKNKPRILQLVSENISSELCSGQELNSTIIDPGMAQWHN